jgi:MYXO-CTERM domain-containing protein
MSTWLLAALLGCGPRQIVTWDRTTTGDAVEDVAVAVLLFGKIEGDRADLRGPHLAGGTLTMDVVASGIGPRESDGWRVASLNPDICDVVEQVPQGERLQVTLAFVDEGETELFVIDELERILDVQHIHVERAAGVRLLAWDDLSSGTEQPLEPPLHLLAGSDADVAVQWTDSRDTPLSGSGLLTHDASPPAGVTVGTRATSETDVLELDAASSASPGSFDITLLADAEPITDVAVEVVGRDEVDELRATVETLRDDEELGASGTVLAQLFREGDRLLGAEVDWLDADGLDLGSGAVLTWEGQPGESSEVTACHGTALCETVRIDGQPIAISDPDAPTPLGIPGVSCGCSSGPSPARALPWALLLLLAQGRRRSSISRISVSRRR